MECIGFSSAFIYFFYFYVCAAGGLFTWLQQQLQESRQLNSLLQLSRWLCNYNSNNYGWFTPKQTNRSPERRADGPSQAANCCGQRSRVIAGDDTTGFFSGSLIYLTEAESILCDPTKPLNKHFCTSTRTCCSCIGASSCTRTWACPI